jgi:uncharacterized protein involved in type VI secretion and phage assembly
MEECEVTSDLMDAVEGRFYGKYRGIVTDNNDPTGRGRIEVIVPAVMGSAPVWALPCVPYAGDNMGFYAIPERDTGVWVEFEAGDPSYPVWVGCFWADGQAPRNEQDTEASPPLKILRTEKGLVITLDDKQEVITLSDRRGKNLITIRVRDGKVTVKGTRKVVVEAPQIELVENASHPIVFGDRLLQYLNQLVLTYQTHTHLPAPPGTPVPPLPPATVALISKRVKAG